MKYFCVAILLALSVVDHVSSFSAGVPPIKAVCKGMLPMHDDYKPQTSAAPYVITLSNATVKAGNNVEVTLKSSGDALFKGFYLQGRDVRGNPVGSFVMNKDAKAHSCGGIRNNAAGHANGKEEKNTVTVTWQAPSDYDGDIQFMGTFVKDFVHIWAGVLAEPLTVKKN